MLACDKFVQIYWPVLLINTHQGMPTSKTISSMRIHAALRWSVNYLMKNMKRNRHLSTWMIIVASVCEVPSMKDRKYWHALDFKIGLEKVSVRGAGNVAEHEIYLSHCQRNFKRVDEETILRMHWGSKARNWFFIASFISFSATRNVWMRVWIV